jgi:hypothetical protein
MADSPAAIMNTHWSLPSQPIGNKERRNNRPMARTKNNKNVNAKLRMFQPFAIHIHDRSGKFK